MESIFDKKSSFKWKSRHWKLQNHTLLQGYKNMSSFDEFNDDKNIKYHYNLFNIKSLSFDEDKPNIMNIEFSDNSFDLHLKFKHYSVFLTWFRIFCSYYNMNHNNNNIPLNSSISYALYHILQTLYFHENVLSTPYIFSNNHNQNKYSQTLVTEIIFNLLTESNDVNHETINDSTILSDHKYINNIHCLTKALLDLLQFIQPYCLFGHYQIEYLNKKIRKLFSNDYNKINVTKIDISKMNNLKNIIYNLYNKKHQTQSNRYAFLSILFNLLNKISNNESITKMSYSNLAEIFCVPLESKLYLYKHFYDNDMDRSLFWIKILIFHANDIFPTNKEWKISELIICQGLENEMVTKYDRKHSEKYLDLDDITNKELMDENNKTPLKFVNAINVKVVEIDYNYNYNKKVMDIKQNDIVSINNHKKEIGSISPYPYNSSDEYETTDLDEKDDEKDELCINTEPIVIKPRSPTSPKRNKTIEKRRLRDTTKQLSCGCNTNDEKLFCAIM